MAYLKDTQTGKVVKVGEENVSDYDRGRWDVLYELSCAYYGKQYYFIDGVGIVYSRDSCRYMTLDDAIDEFQKRLGWDGE